MATGANERFLRQWHEINHFNIYFRATSREEATRSSKKWFPYSKGGDFKKWYGNYDLVVNWAQDGLEIRSFSDRETGRIRSHNYNLELIFGEGITWTAFSSSPPSFRLLPSGFIFDSKGSSLFLKNDDLMIHLLSVLNSVCGIEFFKFLSATNDFKLRSSI